MSEEESAPTAEADKAVRREKPRFMSPDDAYVVRRWWQRLTQADTASRQAGGGPPPWPRSVRAVLKRCDTPEAVLLTEGFRHLWFMLEAQKEPPRYPRSIYRWACVALVLAQLNDEQVGVSLGKRLGTEKKNTGRPLMSELRFQQLLSSESPEELVRRLRRGLDLVGREGVSSVYLAGDILQWSLEYEQDERLAGARPTERVRFQWANDYFNVLASYQREAAS